MNLHLKYFAFLILAFLLCLYSCKPADGIASIKPIEHEGLEYLLHDSLVIRTSAGVEIALLVVRQKGVTSALPSILQHTIYKRDNDYMRALIAAKNGYVGVVSYTRGKAWSRGEVIPYEHEGGDVYQVIDWITKQDWSNGEVGMQGGSYNGFTQWAAAKKLHPALKTIVPAASSSPGIGEPAENGVYMTFLYPWFPFVSNNKTLDHDTYGDHERWNSLKQNYYSQGIAYRQLDSLDGTPNPLFHKQLKHPTYDEYWQDMMPYQEDFARIKIPILSTTGYYDGGQIGALYYLKQHYKYNQNANHYLVIGPFGHLGSQYVPEHEINGYKIDSAAQINIVDLSYKWFNYIFKDAPRPDLLKDKINFQVMGSNTWRHVAKPSDISNDTLKFYLNAELSDVPFLSKYGTGNNGLKNHYSLTKNVAKHLTFIPQEVDLTDRTMEGENNYWNPQILSDSLPLSNGLSFTTSPFQEDIEFSGSYSGNLKLEINKKDVDCSIVIYEETAGGQYFKLTQQFIGRASLAKDHKQRQLLTPGKIEDFPFTNVRMTSRLLKKGSRLILVLNVNKHPHEQVNYGTGKDVSDETMKDAGEPLKIKWYNESFVKIPVFIDDKQ